MRSNNEVFRCVTVSPVTGELVWPCTYRSQRPRFLSLDVLLGHCGTAGQQQIYTKRSCIRLDFSSEGRLKKWIPHEGLLETTTIANMATSCVTMNDCRLAGLSYVSKHVVLCTNELYHGQVYVSLCILKEGSISLVRRSTEGK